MASRMDCTYTYTYTRIYEHVDKNEVIGKILGLNQEKGTFTHHQRAKDVHPEVMQQINDVEERKHNR